MSSNLIDNKTEIDECDFVYYCRIDLFIKDYFYEVFNPNWTTIRFPTILWKRNCMYKDQPQPNYMMIFIPKKYFNHLENMVIGHEAWYEYINTLKMTHDDLDVMIDTYHDSDSNKDFNPMYYIVNRPENKVWHDENEKFIKPTVEHFMAITNNNNIILFILLIIIIYLLLQWRLF